MKTELNSSDPKRSKANTILNPNSSSKLKFAKVLMFFGLISLIIGIFLLIIVSGKTTAETSVDELTDFLSSILIFVSPISLVVSSLFLGGVRNLKNGKFFFATAGAIGYAILGFAIFFIITMTTSKTGNVDARFEFIIILLFSFLLSFIAIRKGFSPFAWILTGGLIGLIIIGMLPSANDPEINDDVRKYRRKKGNDTGLISSLIILIITYIFFLYLNH